MKELLRKRWLEMNRGDLADVPSQIAMAEKIAKYQGTGVKPIWAINPEKQNVELCHPNQPTPIKILKLDGENIIPGFKLKVATLFENEG